jgi:coproporphyrinogen III oxidase
MIAMVRQAQDRITLALTERDPSGFQEDRWTRDGGGGGITRVLQDGAVFDNAGVNTSVVHGELPEAAMEAMRAKRDLNTKTRQFFATGISLVLHPRNPMAPTVHANYRYFELGDREAWWFGGGADLTPSYLFKEDATHFHGTLKSACDRHDPAYYPRFKPWCDRYFHIPHRGEARGVGGIFFDDLNDRPQEEIFAFSKDCAASFLPSYLPILDRRRDLDFTDGQRAWQGLRRGRYVEFNLVYDRGTIFGLRTGARTDSVLMSLPRTARWGYAHQPEPGSPEAALTDVLREPRAWA